MAANPGDIFTILRRSRSAWPQATEPKPFHFRIHENSGDFFVSIVNLKGIPANIDYRAYTGATRHALRAYSHAHEDDLDRFSWEPTAEASEGIRLSTRSTLFDAIARCDNIVNKDLESIQTHPQEGRIRLIIEAEDGDSSVCRTRFEIRFTDESAHPLHQPHILCDGFLLDDRRIFRCGYLGECVASLGLFITRFPKSRRDTLLTLFASAFPTLDLYCRDHTVELKDSIEARAALLIEDVDEQGNLLLEPLESIGDLPIDFVRDYEIARYVSFNEEARRIEVREVRFTEAHTARADLTKRLNRLARANRGATAFIKEEENGKLILGNDLAQQFLTEHLADVARDFVLLGTTKLKRYRIHHERPRIHLRLKHGIDFLEGDGEMEIAGERLSLTDALAHYRKNNFIPLSNGERAVIDASIMARLQRIFKGKQKRIRVSFFDIPLMEEIIAPEDMPALPESREIFRGFNRLADRSVNLKPLRATLRPYQLAGLKWLDYLHSCHLGGCLADDMGLGKTVQTIALFVQWYPKTKAPTIVVMPRSLLFNWAGELATFAPKLSTHIHYGQGRDWEEALRHKIILTTYGTLRADIGAIARKTFHAVVLDESQAIKNELTQTAKAVFALKAPFRLALSGTPVENHLAELYALFRFLNPSMFPNRAEFERDYAQPIQQRNDAEAATALRKKIYPFILRRRKADVLKELPDKVEQTLIVEMGSAQKAHYESRRRFYKEVVSGEIERHGVAKSQFAILEAFLELRQIATVPESKTDGAITSAKRERLLEALHEAIDNGHKCLVFTNFLAGVEQVCESLNAEGIEHLRMTGATSKRGVLVERFQEDSRIKVFVMTLKTGGLGLNLTAADTVFILDPWWNTAAEAQAVDRAHRIGQKQTVFTYRLIARGSIEEKIQALQERKKTIIDQVVSSEGALFKSLTETDIEQLFST